jgi:hypothetical protein
MSFMEANSAFGGAVQELTWGEIESVGGGAQVAPTKPATPPDPLPRPQNPNDAALASWIANTAGAIAAALCDSKANTAAQHAACAAFGVAVATAIEAASQNPGPELPNMGFH